MFNNENFVKDNLEFEKLVLDYMGRLIKVSKKIVYNEEDAKDIVQESFLDYYSKKNLFLNKSSIYTYLCRIVINKSIDQIKKNSNKNKKELLYF